MAQFYFLSVLLNILAGLILVYGKRAGSVQAESSADGSDEAAGEKEVSDEKSDSLYNEFKLPDEEELPDFLKGEEGVETISGTGA